MLAKLFRNLFKIAFFRKKYYGFYIKIFRPLGLFRNQVAIRPYGAGLKIKLHLDEWIQQQIYFMGAFDQKGINFLKHHLKPGDVFIDIGANIGCYTLVASQLTTPTGKVIAFEAIRHVYEQLQHNINLNHLSNVTAEHQAVYEKADELKFFVSSRENMGMSSIFRHDTESGETEITKAVALDDYISNRGIKRIDLIKIDIEGAELFALRGMRKTLSTMRPVLMMELSDDVLPGTPVSKEEILGMLSEHGYYPMALNEDGIPVPTPTDPKTKYHNFVFFPTQYTE